MFDCVGEGTWAVPLESAVVGTAAPADATRHPITITAAPGTPNLDNMSYLLSTPA